MFRAFLPKFLKDKNENGFTLPELMMVVVIIGVLVAIAVPVYNNASNKAKIEAEAANIRTIEGSISAYLADKDKSGAYIDVVMSSTGAISGNNVTTGNLVSDYLQVMPVSPYGSTVTYTKAANERVKSSH